MEEEILAFKILLQLQEYIPTVIRINPAIKVDKADSSVVEVFFR